MGAAYKELLLPRSRRPGPGEDGTQREKMQASDALPSSSSVLVFVATRHGIRVRQICSSLSSCIRRHIIANVMPRSVVSPGLQSTAQRAGGGEEHQAAGDENEKIHVWAHSTRSANPVHHAQRAGHCQLPRRAGRARRHAAQARRQRQEVGCAQVSKPRPHALAAQHGTRRRAVPLQAAVREQGAGGGAGAEAP